MDVSGTGSSAPESFGPAADRLEESSSEEASGYQDAPSEKAAEGESEGDSRLSPNGGDVPRESFAEPLQRGEA